MNKKELLKITDWILRDKYNNKWSSEIINDLSRIKSGEPVDYVIGWKPFLNCKIDLSFKPLIPRPETEFWVDLVITAIISRPNKSKIKIADVFAGSGCIGAAVLKNTQGTTVDFFEKDKNIVKQIKKNLSLNKIAPKSYKVFGSDVLEKARGKYDIILANPPYIATSARKTVQKNVLKNEPRLALFGGKTGLVYIKKLLTQAKNRLAHGGQIWMEFSPAQKPEIEKILNKKYTRWQFQKDQYGKWRFVIIFSE